MAYAQRRSPGGKGELGIVPGSMGAKSSIVRGKGSAESFQSCAHGAGRMMSEPKPKRFKSQDLQTQTEGVECCKDDNVIDEIPAAYKNLEAAKSSASSTVSCVRCAGRSRCVTAVQRRGKSAGRRKRVRRCLAAGAEWLFRSDRQHAE